MERSVLGGGSKLVHLLYRLCMSESKVPTLVLAGMTFILVLLHFAQRANYPFYHDSLYYWGFANEFGSEKFSLLNYSNELRGYLFPFLLFILKKQADLFGLDAKLLFYVYSALFFTILSVFIIPWSFRTIFQRRTFLWGRLLITLLLFFFWRGHFLYPLSDFPAFASLLIGVTLLLSSLMDRTVPLWALCIGLFIGVAVNIRPVYQVSLVIITPLVLLHLHKIKAVRGITWISLVLLGFILILLPQMQINRTHFKVNSPWVLARVAGDENLYTKQLFWGLGTQKVETNIGNNYPLNVVVYRDQFILTLQKTNLLREKTFSRYVKIIKRFPLETAVSYFRHLFNGLDIFFPTPYVKNVYANHTLLSLVNYLIWFLVILHLLKIDLTKRDYLSVLGVISLLSPVVLAIPTAIEVRFFLPVYMLAYGTVAFGIDYEAIAKNLLDNRWKILRFFVIGILWIILCFSLSMTTIENLVR